MDNKKMQNIVLELEKEIFESTKIQEMVSLLDSVAQDGPHSLDNFPLAINLISDLSYENCKKLKALFEELYALTQPNKTSNGSDAA